MNIEVLHIELINGSRVATENPEGIDTMGKLKEKRKELLAKLYAAHPEMDDKTKRKELAVAFHYRETTLRNPDPRFMPKPLCECGETAQADDNGMITCPCGRVWYNELYDKTKFCK